MKSKYVGLLTIVFIASLSCRNSKDQSDLPSSERVTRHQNNTDHSDPDGGFNLVNAESYEIHINGCASGYTLVVTEANPDVQVYKGDRNCLAKLTIFTDLSGTYVEASGIGFQTHLPGDTGTFINGNLESVEVTVLKQLSNPTVVTDQVDYRILDQVNGGNSVTLLDLMIGPSGKYSPSGSIKEPRYSIYSAKFVNGDPSTGAGIFEIILECQKSIRSRGSNYSCFDDPIDSLSFALAMDIYNDEPCTSQTSSAGCEAIIAAGPTYFVDIPTDIINPGDLGLKNGGIRLLYSQGGVPGPEDMANNPNMLLVMTNGISYKWFNIDVKVSMGLLLHQMALYGLEAEE